MFVGVGASRVRDLFKQAKENRALHHLPRRDRRRRPPVAAADSLSGGHDEREQTLNAILVEMDGFESNDQVSSSSPRPTVRTCSTPHSRGPAASIGSVGVSLPGHPKGRLEILEVHAKKVPLGPTTSSCERIARGTPMFAGADLAANLVNEAAIIATHPRPQGPRRARGPRRGAGQGQVRPLEAAADDVTSRRRSASRPPITRPGTRCCSRSPTGADPLHKVTIIPRGRLRCGASMSACPRRTATASAYKWLKAAMRRRRAAAGSPRTERPATSASGAAMPTSRRSRGLARAMILDWGMSSRSSAS